MASRRRKYWIGLVVSLLATVGLVAFFMNNKDGQSAGTVTLIGLIAMAVFIVLLIFGGRGRS